MVNRHGILLAGICDEAIGQTINLGQGNEISINELAREVGEAVGVIPNIIYDSPRPGDVLRLYANSLRAKKLLGFAPKVSLQTGLLALKTWYLQMDIPPELLLQSERPRNWE